MKLEDRLSKAIKAASAVIGTHRRTEKGFANGQAEAGIHVHSLERESGRTKLDGAHTHLFRLPSDLAFRTEDGEELSIEAGALLMTEEDGPHVHELSAPEGGHDMAELGGSEHRHLIVLAEGAIELITSTDGSHDHELQTWQSAFDGAHKHTLHLADLELESLSGADFWEALGSPEQANIPPALPASEMAEVPEGVELDPEELDVRIANVAVGKRSIVVDPVEDLERLAQLNPHLEGLAKACSIEAVAEVALKARAEGDCPVLVWQAETPTGTLPCLKVADPTLIVSRLVDGLPVGLLSKQRQTARVGRPQALVNEVSGGGSSFVHAIVSQREPVTVEKVTGLEELVTARREELAEALDEKTIVSLGKGASYYLPLDLGVVFDPPIELRRPPVGRRFAAKVSLPGDSLNARQLTIDEALRLAARDEVVDVVHRATPASLRKAADSVLVEVDRGLHNLFDDLFAGNDAVEAAEVPRRDVISAHVMTLQELERRGIETLERDALATETVQLVRGTPATKQRGDGHVHPLPAPLEGMTEPAAGRDHTHRFGDNETGGPVQDRPGRDVRHRHEVKVEGMVDGLTGTEHTPDGTRKQEDGLVIQTLIFSREEFQTLDQAVAWAKDHDFRSDKTDELEETFRLRQKDPSEFDPETFRTITLTDGVQAVVGRLKAEALEQAESRALAEKSQPIRVVKADDSDSAERYVFGVVLVPNETDAQGDVYSAEEVRKAAHSYMEHFGGDTFKIMHNGEPVDGVVVLETYLSKVAETHGGETFPVGTWFLATRVINDDLWEAVQQGAFTGYSMGGSALREALS